MLNWFKSKKTLLKEIQSLEYDLLKARQEINGIKHMRDNDMIKRISNLSSCLNIHLHRLYVSGIEGSELEKKYLTRQNSICKQVYYFVRAHEENEKNLNYLIQKNKVEAEHEELVNKLDKLNFELE